MQNLILQLSQPVSNEVRTEKKIKYSKYYVFGLIPRYFLSEFSIVVGLFLKALGLGAEFNSASDPTNFKKNDNGKVCLRPKIPG